MNVLITGIAGFIGSHLAERMLLGGHNVYGIDNLTTGRIENVPKGVRFTEADIAYYITPVKDEKFDGWDVIFHCAASYDDRSNWERDAETNVLGTINVVREAEWSKKTFGRPCKIVYFQTSLCYGPNPILPVKIHDDLDPRGSYAVSKTAGEAYIRDSGVPYVSLRLANIYGPRNLSGPVPTFYKRLTEGQPITVVDSRRDFVYIDDLVDAAVKAALHGAGVYHVSTGTDYPIWALLLEVGRAAGVQVPDYTLTPRGPDDVATLLLDPARTERELGWRASAKLSDGIGQAVEWYKNNPFEKTYTHLAVKG